MKIAIIPARGGSKRVPHKNIIDFLGKPIIAYTIDAAVKSEIFDRIIVSTDSEEIADISIKYGAEVPFLRKSNSDDFTPVSEATLGALLQAEEYYQCKFENVVQLMANCPNRNSVNIIDAYNYFSEHNIDFLISCFKYGWMNPWWAATLDDQNRPSNLFDKNNMRSQDLPDLYCPTGAIWIAKSAKLKEERTFYGADFRFYEINWENAVDIDNMEDLKFAKCVYNLNS